MLFLKRKPGESLVIQTPNGPIIIRLDEEEIGIEVPPGIEVMPDGRGAGSWLPARPRRAPRSIG
jgi:hypothetical protein